MSARDRTITSILVGAALVAWLVVAVIFATLSPVDDAGVQILGAVALGSAVSLTLWPLLWSPRRESPGALAIAGRRSAISGMVVGILVILSALDAVQLPIVLFLLIGAVLIEVAMTVRR